jgi:hypothetical protein
MAARPSLFVILVTGSGDTIRSNLLGGRMTTKFTLAPVIALLCAAPFVHAQGNYKYSYDIATPNKPGIDEVDVDALTGKVIAVAHETPEQMKKEAAEEANDAKAKAAAAPKPKKP